MAPQLIPEDVKLLKIVSSTGIKNKLEVLAPEERCLANVRPPFDKMLTEKWRQCDLKMIVLLLAAMAGSTKVNF